MNIRKIGRQILINIATGDTASPSHTTPASSSAILTTSVSETCLRRLVWEVPRFRTSCLQYTRECSLASRSRWQSVLLRNVVACCLVWYSCSCGRPSYTIQLHAGHGTPMAGRQRWAALTLRVAHRCTLLQVSLRQGSSCFFPSLTRQHRRRGIGLFVRPWKAERSRHTNIELQTTQHYAHRHRHCLSLGRLVRIQRWIRWCRSYQCN